MTGKYRHSIDDKGRIFVPAKLLHELGDIFYVTIGLRHSLMILPKSTWEALEEKKRSMPISAAQDLRFLFANAERCSPDKQGRILLPTSLREYAHLSRETVILGFGDTAEIWDGETYDKMEAEFLSGDRLDAALLQLEV